LKRKIVIAEDQTIVRKGLRSLLESEENIEVIAEARDGLETVKCVEKHSPDLVLLDLAMPKMSGLSALKDIKERFEDTKILVLTFHTSEEYILEAFGNGADGYCLKNDINSELLTAINSVFLQHGQDTRMVAPCPGAVSISSKPPNRIVRSLMLSSPIPRLENSKV
jgi:DNA-binding NarL/FixJ family response regulator